MLIRRKSSGAPPEATSVLRGWLPLIGALVLASSFAWFSSFSLAATALAAAYGLNEGSGTSVVDSSSLVASGTLHGATWTTGKYGKALSFNSSSQYVDLGNPSILRLRGDSTWSAWVFATGDPSSDGTIVAKSDDANGWRLESSRDTGAERFAVELETNGASVQRNSQITRQLNTWYHVAGTYKASARTLHIYVNGVLDDGVLSGTVPSAIADAAVHANIGHRTGSSSTSPFKGKIDEVRLYNRVLTQAEIQADMNTPIPPPPADTTAPTVPTNLSAAAISSSQVNLSWTASTDNIKVAGYRVFRNGSQVATSAATTYQDQGLVPHTAYAYTVAAYDAAGNVSARSASATATTQVASAGPAYPLKISADGRHLVDQDGAPFLVQGDSAWSLIASPTEAEAFQYLENRRLKGFNTVLVSLIEHKFTDNAPNDAAGDGPFLTPGDFSTPNEAYFAHVDRVIQSAASKGILVLLTPAYLGYNGGDEGWYQEMSANGATKLRNYGRYLGNRYKNFTNILWVEAGDYIPPNHTLVNAVALGILDNDPTHLHTAHCNRGTSASDCFGNEPWLNVNSAYTNYVTYDQIYRDYARTPFRPFFLIEAVYENEGGITSTQIRAEAYRSILSGSQGQLFGNNPIWSFDGPPLYPPPYTWQTGLDAQGSRDMSRVNPLFASRDWTNLVPDRTHVVVTAGYGTYTTDQSQSTNDYAATARTADGRLAMTYMPTRRTITVDMTTFSGPVAGKWYDPTNGIYTIATGSPFANTGSRTFTPVGNNSSGTGDWVLVLEAGS